MFLLGCTSLSATPSQSDPPGTIYQYDIHGSVNGTPFDGVGVIPYAKTYEMRIISRVDVDAFTITSCHRDLKFENVIELGWFEDKKGYGFQFVPDQLENHGSCIVRFGAYNKSAQGQNSWGLLDFETPDATLPATNICNGAVNQSKGVSICQSKAGLMQAIAFATPVRIAANRLTQNCIPTTKDNLNWDYIISSGECVIDFKEIDPPGRIHRHDTVGYTAVQIRGQ